MPRLKHDDEAARAAAITAMSLRLAAAGPRTRQRLRDRRGWSDEGQSYAAADAYWRDETSDAAPNPWSWHDFLTAARRSTLLGSAAACGFGLVLIGLNLSIEHRGDKIFSRFATRPMLAAPTMEDVASATLSPPDSVGDVTHLAEPSAVSFAARLPPPPVLEFMTRTPLSPPDAAAEVAALSDPQARSFAAVAPPAAAPPETEASQPASSQVASAAPTLGTPSYSAPVYSPPAYVAPVKRTSRPAASGLAVREAAKVVRVAPALPGRSRLLAPRAFAAARAHGGETLADLAVEPMPAAMPSFRGRAARLVLARYQRPASAANFDVTRWLAQEPTPAPRVLVMSPPPHMLTHPADKVVAQAAPVQAAPVAVRPAPPPPRRLPPLVVASSSYPSPDAVTPPAYRAYYPPAYAAPYGAPYYPPAYGGYYGGAPQ